MTAGWTAGATLAIIGLVDLTGRAVPVEIVAAGEQSDVRDSRQVVARTQEAWERLWKEHAPRQPIPKVDLGERMVVGVFLGTRPTSGFAVRITAARLASEILVLEYAERQPSASAMVMQVVSAPFQIVSLPKHAGEVRFEPIPTASAMR